MSSSRNASAAISPPPLPLAARAIVHRTRGRTHGPITRLFSPGDLGEVLKPFVFLDHFDLEGASFGGMTLHPHSGISTVTYLFDGSVSYEDTTGRNGTLQQGSLEWFKAGAGAWHGGGADGESPARGFQLWVALPPEDELGEVESLYVEPAMIPRWGSAHRLLGAADAAIAAPGALTYQAVSLEAGDRWRLEPEPGHSVAWLAVSRGVLHTPDLVDTGELVVFEPGENAIEIEVASAAEFVVGTAVPHPHDLTLGYYSVHTSRQALEFGEARIAEIGQRLRAEGRR